MQYSKLLLMFTMPVQMGFGAFIAGVPYFRIYSNNNWPRNFIMSICFACWHRVSASAQPKCAAPEKAALGELGSAYMAGLAWRDETALEAPIWVLSGIARMVISLIAYLCP